jgi:serine/threonine-protein kinase ATR
VLTSLSIDFTNLDIASTWLTTSRLARKGDFTPAAFNSIQHASRLGDDASKIEYSKLLWKQGHNRKAIQNLHGSITSSAFATTDLAAMDVSVSVSTTTTADGPQAPNKVKARALLLHAKWLDKAGQTQSSTLKSHYANGITTFPKWDKGHYYLGRYYLKLYESEKALPVAKQAANFVAGELTKLVIENYIRSTVYGSKYYYQTIPKILTLWLDMGTEVLTSQPRLPKDKELHQHKLNHLDHISKYIKRYASERMPAYPWYTAFPQIITRISHLNKSVWEVLQLIILKVAGQYPQQSLWSLLAVLHSTQDDRRARGSTILKKLTVSDSAGQAGTVANRKKDSKKKASGVDLKHLIIHGQQLTDSLLLACDAPIEQRTSKVHLARDLGFKLALAPCALVVPIEATMIPTLPSGNDSRTIRAHNPFPQDAITISKFEEDVLVLNSLQRPRKITVVGSDGNRYGLLCKPKDDLRKDQRLMEFNAMINRALQKDIEASKRRLYIKTYGVTPLNEECGTIEWVEGLKPMRDIIIRLYRQKNVNIDYGEIRLLLNEASSDPAKTPIFTEKILKNFQPVLHEWFVESFPEPEAWFAARVRYTRSCAVMSIVGHVLGLGDRHGENVLLEEGNGGTFHVDFNCLFDKGLTFEKPELVPFRLTHNMVDAMGPAGVEGPFRKTAELTYSLLRQHEDTLITILETFVHDPTADFLGSRRKKKIPGVAETPQEVLEIVRGKLGGFVRGESVPLSVEGYVDSLVRGARDPRNLAAMYIGWCAFF